MDKDSSESEDEFHMSDYDNEPDLPSLLIIFYLHLWKLNLNCYKI